MFSLYVRKCEKLRSLFPEGRVNVFHLILLFDPLAKLQKNVEFIIIEIRGNQKIFTNEKRKCNFWDFSFRALKK